MYLPAAVGIACVRLALVVAYCAVGAVRSSASAQLWLPVVAPAGLMAPAGALFAAGWQYFDVVRDKRRLARSLGLFVPPHVVEQLVRKPGAFESTRESLDCSCLVTDAADYTTLSETLQSEQLAALLNQYFEALFRPVLDLGGYVSDVIGDSMLALWPDRGGEHGKGGCACAKRAWMRSTRSSASTASRRSPSCPRASACTSGRSRSAWWVP